MPYVSQAQRNFFNSPAGRAKVGSKEVDKWNAESKGHASDDQLPAKLPKRAGDPPGANLTMRPAVAPANIGKLTGIGGGGGGKLPGYPKAVRMPKLSMAKPRVAKSFGKLGPNAPAGTRAMMSGFGSMAPKLPQEDETTNPVFSMKNGGF